MDLISIVNEADNAIRNTQYAIRKSPFTIALMGCEVNGPGEAREADIGIAFGKGSGMLFKKGKIIRKTGRSGRMHGDEIVKIPAKTAKII